MGTIFMEAKRSLILLLIMALAVTRFSTVSHAVPPHTPQTFKLWSIGPEEGLSFTVIDRETIQYTPQGILDLIYAENKKEAALYEEAIAKNNDQEINMLIYSHRKLSYPKILLIKDGIAYINLEGDPGYITSRSGTTGAELFRATVVFNLTEFENIEWIFFVDEGDHFSRGFSSRLNFWKFMPYQERVKYKVRLEEDLNVYLEDVDDVVRYLQEVGDATSIKKLQIFQRQLQGAFQRDREKELRELSNETIAIIKKRIQNP